MRLYRFFCADIYRFFVDVGLYESMCPELPGLKHSVIQIVQSVDIFPEQPGTRQVHYAGERAGVQIAPTPIDQLHICCTS